MTPEDPRHGTNAGATAHHASGTPICEPCRLAKCRANKGAQVDREQGRPRTVELGKRAHRVVTTAHIPQLATMTMITETTLRTIATKGPQQKVRRTTRDALNAAAATLRPITMVGIRRRVQGLHSLGWTCADLARESGVSAETLEAHRNERPTALRLPTAEAVAEAYESMSVRLPEPATAHERSIATKARNRARLHGWPPPLAWDDIDNPDEQPKGLRDLRAGTGRPTIIDAHIEDFDFLVSTGTSEEAAAERLGFKLASFRDQRRRFERQDGGAA